MRFHAAKRRPPELQLWGHFCQLGWVSCLPHFFPSSPSIPPISSSFKYREKERDCCKRVSKVIHFPERASLRWLLEAPSGKGKEEYGLIPSVASDRHRPDQCFANQGGIFVLPGNGKSIGWKILKKMLKTPNSWTKIRITIVRKYKKQEWRYL